MSFGDVLDGEVKRLGLTRDQPGTSSPRRRRDGTPRRAKPKGSTSRRDGNNVQLDRELLTMTRAAGDFAAAQTALSAKFRLVRYAINEGR